MIETILIARDRKTGKDVLLAGREVPFREQVEAYKKLAGPQNDTYETATLAQVQPSKKPLKFITKTEGEQRAKAHAEAVAKAEKEAKDKAEKTKTKTKTEGDKAPK